MKNKTTWIILGVATLGIAGVVYYNWDWIQKNLLGKATLSKSHGTVMGLVEGEKFKLVVQIRMQTI